MFDDDHVSRNSDTSPLDDIPTDIDTIIQDGDLDDLDFPLAQPHHVTGSCDHGDDIEPLDLPEFYD